ncbi:UNVERIFIED_CONTAM: hypothetical protein HHA_290650 [Hammondia hammondi]|eukprot:XP_008889201.1 hypothetical protein HHA_290650 [Hammondia hammondi]
MSAVLLVRRVKQGTWSSQRSPAAQRLSQRLFSAASAPRQREDAPSLPPQTIRGLLDVGRRHRLLQRFYAASVSPSPPRDEGSDLPPFSVCARRLSRSPTLLPSEEAAHASRSSSASSSSASSSSASSSSASSSSASASFSASTSSFQAREEQRRQAMQSFISRLDDLFNLPHQQWLPRHAGVPLGAKRRPTGAKGGSGRFAKSREKSLRPEALSPESPAEAEAVESPNARDRLSPSNARDDALSAQEAFLAACRLASTRGDFQWCLQGLNLLVNFGRLHPDWELSDRLMALSLHCRRPEQAEQLLTAFPHFLACPPSPVLLFALIDEALAAGRPQDVRRIFSTMREQWQMPIRPAFYVAAIRAMLLLPISADQSLKEAQLVAEDAAALGVPLPPVAHQLLVERALSLFEERLPQADLPDVSEDSVAVSAEGTESEHEGGDEGDNARAGTCYTTGELLNLAHDAHNRLLVDQARDAVRRHVSGSSSLPDFFSSLASPPALRVSGAAVSERFLWSRAPNALLLAQAAWLRWATARFAERKEALASAAERHSADEEHGGRDPHAGGEKADEAAGARRRRRAQSRGELASWIQLIQQACAASLQELACGTGSGSSLHRGLPPALLAALIRSREVSPLAFPVLPEEGQEREIALRKRHFLLKQRREAAQALRALQHSAFADRLPPVRVLSALFRSGSDVGSVSS